MRTVFVTLLFASLFVPPLFGQSQQAPEPVEGVVLVKFAPEALPSPKQRIRTTDLAEAASRAKQNQPSLLEALPFEEGRKIFSDFTSADTLAKHRNTGEQVQLLDLSRWYTLTVPDTSRIEALVERLANHPLVEAAAPQVPYQPSVVTPNDDEFQNGDQWNLNNPSNDADIDAPEAWELNKGRSDVTIAVVDGGVDYNHPDLDPGDRSRIIQGADPADDDGDAMDDISSGKGFAGHGTLVAGVAGAITDNDQNIAGVMWNTQIMPVKIAYTDGPWFNPFLGEGDAFPDVIAEGINHARNNGADIINLSLGRPQPPGDAELFFIGNPTGEAIYNAYLQGVVVVASSGNDSQDEVGFPASSAGAISVGNTTFTDERYQDPDNGSNYGPSLDLSAPGSFYPSTKRGGGVDQSVLGTSFSAPMVSGVAGLILSESRDRNLGLTNDDVRHLMQRTADDLGPSGRDDEFGHGRVNARKALASLQPPNDAVQASHAGGSGQKIYDDVKQTFHSSESPDGIASGEYWADVYEVTGHVNFPTYFQNGPPLVWIRERSTKGWSAANPNPELPYVEITNVTQSGFDYTTFVYYVESDILGREINGWYPTPPSNVKIAYTAIGEPSSSPVGVTLSGPSSLNSGETGTWTASVDGGSGALSYQWYEKYDADNSFSPISGATSASYSAAYYGNVTLKAEVTADNGTDSDTHAVNVDCEPFCVESLADTRKRNATVSATTTAETVEVTWQAPGPPRRSRFLVQHRPDSTAAWSTIGSVPASDSLRADSASGPTYRHRTNKLELGTHQFRVGLPQDGGGKARAVGRGHSADARRYAGPVTARIAMDEAYRFSAYPNPVRNQATVELAVRESQEVAVRLYDVLGRRVRTLRSGPLPAQKLQRLRLDVSADGLTSGTYFLRATGEDVAATEKITVVR